jgi:hypothetical protein
MGAKVSRVSDGHQRPEHEPPPLPRWRASDRSSLPALAQSVHGMRRALEARDEVEARSALIRTASICVILAHQPALIPPSRTVLRQTVYAEA